MQRPYAGGRRNACPRPLGLARTRVVVVGAATLVVFASGLWLIEETRRSLGDGWLALSLGLLVAAGLLGAVGGRKPRRAAHRRAPGRRRAARSRGRAATA